MRVRRRRQPSGGSERLAALLPSTVDVVDELVAAGLSVGSRAIDRLAAAHDASHFLLTPQAVVRARDAADVAAAMDAARRHGVPVTFRSGGTSLSGQVSSSGLVIDTRRGFRKVEVRDGGAIVACGPGSTVRAVNARLGRHSRQLGPDPASEIACTIGGVVANNSSGMTCGIEHNAYRTLDSLVFVLPSGTSLDTADPGADARLREREPEIHAGLEKLRDEIRGDAEATARLRRLHAIKNTMGYGLNAFLDFDRPIDILEHLLVGSEGTLAFIAEARFRTVPQQRFVATALLVFADLGSAVAALPALVDAGFAAVELLDTASLSVARSDAAASADLSAITLDEQAALLVEFREGSERELAERMDAAGPLLASLALASPARLRTDAGHREQLWRVRKGLFTAVAGNRPPGTTALLEDIAVPVRNLLATCRELTRLFDVHGYRDSVIFGHAKDGNLHFLLNVAFDTPEALSRFRHFTDDLVDLVLAQDGTLKAEHGTGRVMAPFVARQYGPALHSVMRRVKGLIDPDGMLNPGVLLNDDPEAHLRNLKSMPAVDDETDRCVECGYCEPACPSQDLTLTPRERIVVHRELSSAVEAGDSALATQVRGEFSHAGVDTCAADGMCQTACPVLINTADLVGRMRAERPGRLRRHGWSLAARRWSAVTRVARAALTVSHAVPSALPTGATSLARRALGAENVPLYAADLPRGGHPRPQVSSPNPVAVYFAGCTSAIFGPAIAGSPGVSRAFAELCRRAGIALATPPDLASLCCGTPWKSKGQRPGHALMRERVVASLLRATDGGRLPVVCDSTSCTEGLVGLLRAPDGPAVTVVDATVFADERLLPRLPDGPRLPSLALHPTCASTRLGLNASAMRVAARVADSVTVPDAWSCCGFAGDRGLLHPELTASATRREAAEVARLGASAHASLNRTCELGMTRATGAPYRHLIELLEEVTRPRPSP